MLYDCLEERPSCSYLLSVAPCAVWGVAGSGGGRGEVGVGGGKCGWEGGSWPYKQLEETLVVCVLTIIFNTYNKHS